MNLNLYNSYTKKVDLFSPLDPKMVKLYTCGPTVYNYAHIGNLRTYVFEDILKRVLLANDFPVNHVMNVTDVGHLTSDGDTGDDKMETGALREGRSVWDIAEAYTKAFKSDIEELNILQPDIWCKATEHIKAQIDLIQRIEDAGYAYPLKDGIYFDTSKFKDYTKLANLNVEGLQAGARVEIVEGKRNITDFALWKFSPEDKKRAMEWDSPWGVGFPGWHIECSAMSMEYLGEEIDIHCGGIDHIPVHHTNEIAQVESVTGKPWVNFWLHGEFLVMQKGKMSKSSGSFITLKTLKDEGYDPLSYRYFLLTAHYRSQLTFTFEALTSASQGLKNLKERIRNLDTSEPVDNKKVEAAFSDFIQRCNNDLDMPRALAFVWESLKGDALNGAEKLTFIEKCDSILGLELCKKEDLNLDAEVEALIAERIKSRETKDFARADEIRDTLTSMGIILEDTPEGIRWRKA